MSIEDTIIDLVRQHLGCAHTMYINIKSTLIGDLGCDEIDMIEIQGTIEEEFNITLPCDLSTNYLFSELTVECIVKIVNKRLAA